MDFETSPDFLLTGNEKIMTEFSFLGGLKIDIFLLLSAHQVDSSWYFRYDAIIMFPAFFHYFSTQVSTNFSMLVEDVEDIMLAVASSHFPLHKCLTCHVGSMFFSTACGGCRVVSLLSTTWETCAWMNLILTVLGLGFLVDFSATHRHRNPHYYHWQSSGLTTTYMYKYFTDELASCHAYVHYMNPCPL